MSKRQHESPEEYEGEDEYEEEMEEEEEEDDNKKKAKTTKKQKTTTTPRTRRPWTDDELRQLQDALIIFGADRTQDIISSCKLSRNRAVVRRKLDELIEQQKLSKTNSKTTPTISTTPTAPTTTAPTTTAPTTTAPITTAPTVTPTSSVAASSETTTASKKILSHQYANIVTADDIEWHGDFFSPLMVREGETLFFWWKPLGPCYKLRFGWEPKEMVLNITINTTEHDWHILQSMGMKRPPKQFHEKEFVCRVEFPPEIVIDKNSVVMETYPTVIVAKATLDFGQAKV